LVVLVVLGVMLSVLGALHGVWGFNRGAAFERALHIHPQINLCFNDHTTLSCAILLING
jgi:hypothetical protein